MAEASCQTAGFAVICTNPSWGHFAAVGWGHPCEPAIKVFGSELPYIVNDRRPHVWASKEEADRACEWLTQANRRFGFRFEVQKDESPPTGEGSRVLAAQGTRLPLGSHKPRL